MTRSEPTIYFDNAATSWPKPDEVAAAVSESLRSGGSPGRGAHAMALAASRAMHESRRKVAAFLGVADPRNLIFQPGCTQAANLVLEGFLQPGDRVLVSSVEHNSVTRPLSRLAKRGVEIIWIPVDDWGVVDVCAAEAALAAGPVSAIVCQHASNFTGAIQPVGDLADLAREHGAKMIVDGAQAAGHLSVDLAALRADAWFCSGHKALLGPQGVGVLYLAPDFDPEELVVGGTGSGGAQDMGLPRERPDCFEAGTPPLPAIMGLAAAVGWLAGRFDDVRAREHDLTCRLHEGLGAIPTIRVLGPSAGYPRVPVLAITSTAVSSDQIASELDQRWNIAVRAGLHCTPSAHEVMGTLETGAVRFGIGGANTADEVDAAIKAVATIISEAR